MAGFSINRELFFLVMFHSFYQHHKRIFFAFGGYYHYNHETYHALYYPFLKQL